MTALRDVYPSPNILLLTRHIVWPVLAMADLWPPIYMPCSHFPQYSYPWFVSSQPAIHTLLLQVVLGQISSAVEAAIFLVCLSFCISLRNNNATEAASSLRWDASELELRMGVKSGPEQLALCTSIQHTCSCQHPKGRIRIMGFFLYTLELVEALVEHPSAAFHLSSFQLVYWEDSQAHTNEYPRHGSFSLKLS